MSCALMLLLKTLIVIGVTHYLSQLASFKLLHNNQMFIHLIQFIALCTPFLLLWKRHQYCQRFNQLPGFRTNFGIIGNLDIIYSFFKRNKNEALATREMCEAMHTLSSEKYGKGLFVFWAGPQPMVYVSSPNFIQILMIDYDLPKGSAYDLHRMLMGDGLLASQGDKWSYHRKLLTPSFNFKVLDSFMHNMRKNVYVLISKLEEEANSHPERLIADITKYIFPCAMDVLCESSMGINVGAQEDPNCDFHHSFHKLMEAFCDICVKPSLWINRFEWAQPFSSFGRRVAHFLKIFREKSNRAIDEQFDQFKKNWAQYSDSNNNNNVREPFINTLFREHMQHPNEFPMASVRDEVNTFMAAGHDTIGWALTYALFMIGHHPEIQAKVHEEVDNFFSNFESDEDIQIDSLKELKYTDAVMKETLRLYSPVPVVTREANKDLKVGQYFIPRGTQVLLGLRQVHRDPEHWTEPARFKPERFLDFKVSHSYAFVPFSAGTRNCIGQRYAMVQLKSMFAFIMRHYTIDSLDPIESVCLFGAPVSIADRPIRVKLLKRQQLVDISLSSFSS